MKILQISDTHSRHLKLKNFPKADVIVHCGDFADNGTEGEVLDFLNWFMMLPYPQKIFVTGNHDLCLWDATGIEDLPDNMHFLQDCGCEINGVKFFGLAYNHPEILIPEDVDVLVTHEPPIMEEEGIIFSNGSVLDDVMNLRYKPRVITIEDASTTPGGCGSKRG